MLALYRKYRPTSLDSLVGQDSIKSALSEALKSGKISHSYLFTGPRGTGKTSVARILAHEVNGFPYQLEDSYLDIVEIDAASNTGVDNIRDLREKALIAPAKGKYKVYIIDEVHMLSKSAFNALLKTLEEPPAHVIFILATTDLEKVPVTITSRSQVFHFRLASPEVMSEHLRKIADAEKIPIDDAALNIIVRRGGGSFRDSLSLLDQLSTLASDQTPLSEARVAEALGLPLDSAIKSLLSAYASADRETITKLLKDLLNEGLKPESLAESAIKSILASPEPPLLPLLEKLPSVSAPFPEAKLLLAFLSFSEKNHRKIEKIIEKPKNNIQKNNSNFNLNNFLENIKLTNSAIYLQLQKCKLSLDGTTLNIYPTQKITKTILNRKNNSDILKDHLPEGFELIIHDLEDLKSDPKISKISDIMGNVQEVNKDGGIPF